VVKASLIIGSGAVTEAFVVVVLAGTVSILDDFGIDW
jgi:hypothetical protein